MKITINLDPGYIILEDGKTWTCSSCGKDELAVILALLGCVHWPLRDCVIRITLPEDSTAGLEIRRLLNCATAVAA